MCKYQIANNETLPPHSITRQNSSHPEPGDELDEYIKRRKTQFDKELQYISIWTSPLLVLTYFVKYILHKIQSLTLYFGRHNRITLTFVVLVMVLWIARRLEGPHQNTVGWMEQQVAWYGYWIILGVASSVGLGSGLHTFILFLGPYIAEVTLAVYECNTTSTMARNPSTYRLECTLPLIGSMEKPPALGLIYQCIAMETLAWGIGTALGELPPYFMARAVAISGGKNQELSEFETSMKKLAQDRTLKETVSSLLYIGMKKLGFFGILLFASIPNPLFDLAGITCGHFLIPFTTFFGATLLGKACIKSSIQAVIVIITFSHGTLALLLASLESSLPTLHKTLSHIITDQTRQLNKSFSEDQASNQVGYFMIIWNYFLSLVIGYFVISSIESLGLVYMKQQHHAKIELLVKRKVLE
ncbi:hypothetical protein BC941DRAFT_499262 [Chlamydoabsidia padenii]|nr:hypothetical protein BC941DRAFT_499262 [Chlamydoabsidia padenii]